MNAISLPFDVSLQVMFVDYGNTEEINKSDIKRLDDALERIPPHAIEFAFADPLAKCLTRQQLAAELENKRFVAKIGTIGTAMHAYIRTYTRPRSSNFRDGD